MKLYMYKKEFIIGKSDSRVCDKRVQDNNSRKSNSFVSHISITR